MTTTITTTVPSRNLGGPRGLSNHETDLVSGGLAPLIAAFTVLVGVTTLAGGTTKAGEALGDAAYWVKQKLFG